MDRDIVNTPLYTILTYIMNFFLTNACFLLVISPMIIYIFCFNTNSSIGMLLLTSILLGPAITTLFSVMGKLIRTKDISAIKDFFHFYKLNFWQGILVSIILNVIIAISYCDINYFKNNNNNIFAGLFLIFIVAILMIGFYIYPIISRYNVKIVYAFKLALRLMVTKPYLSITSLSIIVITLFIIRKASIALVGLLFGASVIVYLIMYVENSTITSLEEEVKEKYKNN